MAEAALSLGSNLGNKRANITRALDLLHEGGANVLVRSSDYQTEPWGPVEQDWFVNACALVETDLQPTGLLALCQAVELQLGRTREIRWGPRIIDVDILTYDAIAVASADLTIPHPHMFERAFVLVPLAEIAPDLKVGSELILDVLAGLSCAGIHKLGSPLT